MLRREQPEKRRRDQRGIWAMHHSGNRQENLNSNGSKSSNSSRRRGLMALKRKKNFLQINILERE